MEIELFDDVGVFASGFKEMGRYVARAQNCPAIGVLKVEYHYRQSIKMGIINCYFYN